MVLRNELPENQKGLLYREDYVLDRFQTQRCRNCSSIAVSWGLTSVRFSSSGLACADFGRCALVWTVLWWVAMLLTGCRCLLWHGRGECSGTPSDFHPPFPKPPFWRCSLHPCSTPLARTLCLLAHGYMGAAGSGASSIARWTDSPLVRSPTGRSLS